MRAFRFICLLLFLVVVTPGARSVFGVEVDASAPRSVILSIYDTDFALGNELRSVVVAQGENTIRFPAVPRRIDPGSVVIALQAGPGGPEVLEQYLTGVAENVSDLLGDWLDRDVIIQTARDAVTGRILSAPDSAGIRPLLLREKTESVLAIPASERIDSVRLSKPGNAPLTPELHMRCISDREGPLNVRLLYTVHGLRWQASYRVLLDESAVEAFLSVRVSLENDAGARFERARVRLVETQKGGVARPVDVGAGVSGRYPYGDEEPTFERAVASAAAWRTFEVPQPVTLEPGRTTHVNLFNAAKVAASRFYVYDGVKLDRFERNPRSDWNYGTASHNIVDSYLEINNTLESGLGRELPRGLLTAYIHRPDGTMDVAGQGRIAGVASGGVVRVQLGPAHGLRGGRERTGYTEIIPLREYEESFEIRLENASREDAEIRVVEHLYRWHRFEIVKADTEYVRTGDRTIEFRSVLKPGGQRTIHYTVRYRW